MNDVFIRWWIFRRWIFTLLSLSLTRLPDGWPISFFHWGGHSSSFIYFLGQVCSKSAKLLPSIYHPASPNHWFRFTKLHKKSRHWRQWREKINVNNDITYVSIFGCDKWSGLVQASLNPIFENNMFDKGCGSNSSNELIYEYLQLGTHLSARIFLVWTFYSKNFFASWLDSIDTLDPQPNKRFVVMNIGHTSTVTQWHISR